MPAFVPRHDEHQLQELQLRGTQSGAQTLTQLALRAQVRLESELVGRIHK